MGSLNDGNPFLNKKENYIQENIKSFEIMYSTGWGNIYPTDGLVSYFFNIIKPNMVVCEDNVKVLDFACGIGANSKFFVEQGYDVYGIDSSSSAINKCIKKGFSYEKFRCANLLGKEKLLDVFNIQFDLIIALNVLSYFDTKSINVIMQQFVHSLSDGGVFMANMYSRKRSWDIDSDLNLDDNEMVCAKRSGSVDKDTFLNLVSGKEDVKNLFSPFLDTIAITHTIVEDLDGENESIYFFGKKIN